MAQASSKTVTPSSPISLATGPTIARVDNLGPYAVYLGGSGVTTGAGYKLPAGEKASDIKLATLEQVYAISEDGDAEVRVLTSSLV